MMKRALLIGLLAVAITNGTQIRLIGLIGRIWPDASIRAASVAPPRQLTTGGCCTQPFWSQDGKQVLYIDKPAGGKVGIYGVTLDPATARPSLVSERVEDSRVVGPYRIETTSKTTTLVRLSDGKKFSIPAQCRSVQFSPDFKRVAWSISNPDLPPEQQTAVIWVANVDGSGAKRVATLRRGGVAGWISNEVLLVNGQDPKNRNETLVSSLPIAGGKLKELFRAERMRSAALSPSGKWIAYYTAFNPDSENGLWIADTNGGKPQAAPKGSFGAYQWRTVAGEDRLVIVPFKPDAQYHEFWQLDPRSLALTQLTEAEEAPIKIANGDWRVSPDGRYVTYVESKDRNIWVVALPKE